MAFGRYLNHSEDLKDIFSEIGFFFFKREKHVITLQQLIPNVNC